MSYRANAWNPDWGTQDKGHRDRIEKLQKLLDEAELIEEKLESEVDHLE